MTWSWDAVKFRWHEVEMLWSLDDMKLRCCEVEDDMKLRCCEVEMTWSWDAVKLGWHKVDMLWSLDGMKLRCCGVGMVWKLGLCRVEKVWSADYVSLRWCEVGILNSSATLGFLLETSFYCIPFEKVIFGSFNPSPFMVEQDKFVWK